MVLYYFPLLLLILSGKTINTDPQKSSVGEEEPDESTPLMMEGHVGPQISCNNSLTGGADRRRQQRRKVEQLNNYGGTAAAESSRDQTDAVCGESQQIGNFFILMKIVLGYSRCSWSGNTKPASPRS